MRNAETVLNILRDAASVARVNQGHPTAAFTA
jgi:hypothetical protein